MYVVLAHPPRTGGEGIVALFQPLDSHGAVNAPAIEATDESFLPTLAQLETHSPRWVWNRTREWYPQLLESDTTLERCHDITLCRAILAQSPDLAPGSPYIAAWHNPDTGNAPTSPARQLPALPAIPHQVSLFEAAPAPVGPALAAVVGEFQQHLSAVESSRNPARLALLLAAESSGALLAAEMEATGLPWRRDVHEALLEEHLGPRPAEGSRPAALERLAGELRATLGNPALNPDSPQDVLRALHRAGIPAETTRSEELQRHQHPAIAPLLAYKKLSRLLAANGWTWLDTWVRDGRFRTEYIVGGSGSGRWASRGGGALQIPVQIRDAVRADPGHKLVVADAAQLEPRILAALGRDTALAAAARGQDLYAGIAAQGFGGDRAKAKLAMLGAMYGATSGESGRLMPTLARTYPHAVAVVEAAARTGEAGGVVGSHLGRGCPPPSSRWRQEQQSTTAAEQQRAEAASRARGRFTRNFVVQSTAAEWALCWLAGVRRQLRAGAAPGAELVFFLHDEVVLHVPDSQVGQVQALITEAAEAAAVLLFGKIPVGFPVGVAVVDSYADAK